MIIILDAPLLGEDIKSLIPENITLAYWDYYHTDEAIYDDMYRRHLDLNRPISFCAGAWRWLGFAPMNKYGLKRLIPGIHSTLNHKIEDVMLTVWGDDGNECSIYSALPQIVAFGELCRNSEATESDFDRRLTFRSPILCCWICPIFIETNKSIHFQIPQNIFSITILCMDYAPITLPKNIANGFGIAPKN